jgi:hypothetical protein
MTRALFRWLIIRMVLSADAGELERMATLGEESE